MITVEFQKQDSGIEYRTQAWVVRATIISSTRTNILSLFRLQTIGDRTFFSGVASPQDVLELPTAAVDDVGDSYWISDSVDLLTTCERDADEIVRLIKVDLDELDRTLKSGSSLETLGQTQLGS